MGRKWWLPIGTRTTPRKQSVIKHARAGDLQTRHLEYALLKWGRALWYPVRNLIQEKHPGKIIGFDLREFVDNCVKDALIRIKEYDEQYRFRTFLTNKIVFPALIRIIRAARLEKAAIMEYLRWKEAQRRFERDYRYSVAQEFVAEALGELERQDPVKYQVVCLRLLEGLSYKEVSRKLLEKYPLSIPSEASLRKIYERGEQRLKHFFRELVRHKKYIDDDLPFNRYIIHKLHAETTKK